MQNTQHPIYRIIFTQEDKIYEIYANYISEENLMGFIEVEELTFSETDSLLVDPVEERLKTEFQGVKRTYIPMHMILRIDEMAKQGPAKIKEQAHKDNIRHFPGAMKTSVKDSVKDKE